MPLPFPTATEVEKMKEQRCGMGSEGLSPEAGVVRTASTATPSTVRQITPVTPSVRQASPVAGLTSGGPTPVSSGISPVSSARQTPVSSGRQVTPAPLRAAPSPVRTTPATAGLSGEDAKPSQPRSEVQIQTLCGPAPPRIVQPQMLEKGRGDGGAAPVRLIREGSEGSTSPLFRFVSQPLTLTPSTSAGSIVPRWLEPMASGDQRPVLVKSVSVPVMPKTVAPVSSRAARATHPSASPPPPVPLDGLLTAGSLASSRGGSITSKEGSITTQTEDLFNRVDTNGDGIIDRREFRRAIKTRVIVRSSHV